MSETIDVAAAIMRQLSAGLAARARDPDYLGMLCTAICAVVGQITALHPTFRSLLIRQLQRDDQDPVEAPR